MASVMIFIGVVGWICLLVSIIVYFKTKEQKNTNSIKNENEENPVNETIMEFLISTDGVKIQSVKNPRKYMG